MSKTCDICGKGTTFGNKVTFSHRRLNKSFKANVHKVKLMEDGKTPRVVNVCTKCLKTLKNA